MDYLTGSLGKEGKGKKLRYGGGGGETHKKKGEKGKKEKRFLRHWGGVVGVVFTGKKGQKGFF